MEEMTKKGSAKLLVIAVALGLLIVIAGIQAMELSSLKTKLNSELTGLSAAKPAGSGTSSSGASSGNSLQKNIQDLPSMVGGC